MEQTKLQSIKRRIVSNTTVNEETGCWEWNKRIQSSGYGSMWLGRDENGRYQWNTAHRLSYIAFNGPIEEGLEVAHKCHNRKCCCPDHLEATDHETNMKMSVDAGRMPRGTDKPNAKVDDAVVRMVREGSIFKFFTHQQAANIIGISIKTLRDIIYGKTWTHVTV